jgi:hypothetical protein
MKRRENSRLKFEGNTLPRSRATRNDGPKIAGAAVAPITTTRFGLTIRNSASSQGRQLRSQARLVSGGSCV